MVKLFLLNSLATQTYWTIVLLLIKSLGRFDCSNTFLWLVNLVCQGNREVAHEAFDILSAIESVDSIEAKLGFDVLSKTLDTGAIDDWREKLVTELLVMFD